jgi:hypothetical protein
MNQLAQPNLTPAAQAMLAEVDFLPGETLQYSIQGDGFFVGTSPLAKAIAALNGFIATITGGHVRVFVMITSQRILLLESTQVMCGLTRTRRVNAIALSSLAEAGWGKDTMYCCIHTRVVHMESKTQRHTLVIKNLGDPGLREFVARLSAVMIANSNSRTAT